MNGWHLSLSVCLSVYLSARETENEFEKGTRSKKLEGARALETRETIHKSAMRWSSSMVNCVRLGRWSMQGVSRGGTWPMSPVSPVSPVCQQSASLPAMIGRGSGALPFRGICGLWLGAT